MTVKSNKIVSKSELVERVSNQTKFTKSQIDQTITQFLREINEALINGEEVKLIGHFTLKTDWKNESQAVNLQTKEKMTVPAHYIPKCKFSADLKKQIKERK